MFKTMSNVWLPRNSPFGSALTAVVHHGKRAYQDRSPVFKAVSAHDIDLPSKRARVSDSPNPFNQFGPVFPDPRFRIMPRRSYSRRRSVKRRRTPFRRFRRRVRARISTLAPRSKLVRCKASTLRTNGGHAAGSLEMVPIQMNSVLDPFQGAGSGQPLGFDQWRALYEYGYVVGAKITAEFHNADSFAYVVGITPCHEAQGTTSLAAYDYYKEMPGTKSMVLSPDVDKCILQSKIGLKKWLGVKDLVDTNEYRMNLNTPSEPSKTTFFHVWSQPMDKTSTDTTGVQIVITVEYIVLLKSPIVPARSVA